MQITKLPQYVVSYKEGPDFPTHYFGPFTHHYRAFKFCEQLLTPRAGGSKGVQAVVSGDNLDKINERLSFDRRMNAA